GGPPPPPPPIPMMRFPRSPSGVPDAASRRSRSPVAMPGTPSFSRSIAAWVPFPALGGSRNTIRLGRWSSPPATYPAPLHEAFVVPDHQLALGLLDGVHGDADDDQQRG